MGEFGDPQHSDEQAPAENYDAESAYARWAPFYDLIFSIWLEPGRRAGAVAASRIDGRILDVGVGTGLELPLFPSTVRVVGVDLSEPMLHRANHRVRRQRLRHVEGLACMDASRLGFKDASFGCAVLMYVLSVTPQPSAILDEVARVVRPGGEIIVVGRVSPEASALVALEKWIGRRLGSQIGWRPHFPWKVIDDWLESRADAQLIERRRIAPLGLFTLTRIQRTGCGRRRVDQKAGRTPVETTDRPQTQERIPFERNRSNHKNSLKIKMLEQALIEKVYQLFRSLL